MNRWLKLVWILFFMISGHSLFAADSVIVKKDARLDVLSVKQMQSNQRSALMTSNGLYKGFRIQVISTNKRDEATFVQADLQLKYPEEKIYLSFQSPNYKVRIGNFLKKEEAEKFKTELNKLFPNGAYIVEDAVEYILKEGEDIITQ
ncbi:MAG: SPOR domain-containing protein [Bacteroidota bacterium]